MRVLTPKISNTPVIGGAALVGPDIFSEAQRLAEQKGNLSDSQSYHDLTQDSQAHNLIRLRESQNTTWKPPVTIHAPSPVVSETAPDESQLAHFDIYHARNQESPNWNPENILRSLGDAPVDNDQSIDKAYTSMVQSLWFFLEGLGIDSIDAQHMAIKVAVHVGEGYNNAYYTNGTINLGDGDGKLFAKFAEDLTVIAHELGHGIVEKVLGGLTYWSQSGALNESIADVLGVSALQYALGQETTPAAMWLIGQRSMVPYIDSNGDLMKPALRSISFPGTAYVNHPIIGTDSQPDNMDDYDTGSSDNYKVHKNSGIPNKAFYLAATAIGGWSKDTVLKIWLEATKEISKNADFKTFAQATLNKAKELFPNDPKIHNAIRSAWHETKVLGNEAKNKDHEAYRLTDPEVIDIFELDHEQIADLSILINNADLSAFSGVQDLEVGFKLNKDSEATLVILAYMDSNDFTTSLPSELFGYKLVQLDLTTQS